MNARAFIFAVLLWGGSVPAPASPQEHPQLEVDHTAFVLHQPDGQVLRGTQMQGQVVQVLDDDGSLESVKLASIKPDPDNPEILRHEMLSQDAAGAWQPYCEPNADGETWGFPIVLPKNHPGRDGVITLSCASGAVAKCVRYGYPPWGHGPHGEDLLPYHAACVHMIRADYCGDGKPYTKAGTLIEIYDRLGVRPRRPRPLSSDAFEAGWAPQGAVCVARTRWPDLLTLKQLRRSCPRLVQAQECDEKSARAKGALLFNRTHKVPRIGP